MRSTLRMRPFGALTLVAAIVASSLAGCGSKDPVTHTVNGKVVFKGKRGNLNQIAGGQVQVQSTSDPNVTASGGIDDDGSFELTAYLVDQKKGYTGVLPGEYKARVVPGQDDEGETYRGAILPKYQDFNKSGLTFTVPLEGELVLEVERGGR